MSPTYIRPRPPPPPPNRQPRWVFWARFHIGLWFMRAANVIQVAVQRPAGRFGVSMNVFRLGMWISPKARHTSMRRPAKWKDEPR
jgi:hypothetical protein